MSRRRQRGAAYRARRTEYRAMRRGITQTAYYMKWLEAACISVEVATGDGLDKLMELTAMSMEEYKAFIAEAARVIPIGSLEEATAFFGQADVIVTAGPDLTPAERAARISPHLTVTIK